MPVSEDLRGDFDPLAYDPGDRIGLCLDVDGTVYRSGSVFVETLAFLPYADGISLTAADRRHRRVALRAVADYRGGLAERVKWGSVLTGLGALRAVGAERLSEAVLATLVERRRAVRPRKRDSSESDADGYGAMRETVLSAYGALLRGKRRPDVARAASAAVDRRCPVDSELRATLDRLDAELHLITDAPEHVAAAYARKLAADARVTGTAYETAADGRFTGAFDRVDKGTAVARLRADREWDYVLAAGDAPADAAMARSANLFLAVDGQSDLARRLGGPDTASVRGTDRDLRARFAAGTSVVRVPREVSLARALRTVLRVIGVESD